MEGWGHEAGSLQRTDPGMCHREVGPHLIGDAGPQWDVSPGPGLGGTPAAVTRWTGSWLPPEPVLPRPPSLHSSPSPTPAHSPGRAFLLGPHAAWSSLSAPLSEGLTLSPHQDLCSKAPSESPPSSPPGQQSSSDPLPLCVTELSGCWVLCSCLPPPTSLGFGSRGNRASRPGSTGQLHHFPAPSPAKWRLHCCLDGRHWD